MTAAGASGTAVHDCRIPCSLPATCTPDVASQTALAIPKTLPTRTPERECIRKPKGPKASSLHGGLPTVSEV
jgi:hypothetical protein